MEYNGSYITFCDNKNSVEVFIDFRKGDIVKYVISGCEGILRIDDGYCEDPDSDNDVSGDVTITHEKDHIEINCMNIEWYDREILNKKELNADDWKNAHRTKGDILTQIKMTKDDYLRNWNLILSQINPHYKLPQFQVKVRWFYGYHDGPFDGICEYNERLYYYDTIDRPIYGLYELSDEEIKEEVYYHELFRKYYGKYTDYIVDENEEYKREGLYLRDTDKKEYEELTKDRKHRNYKNNKLLGWFIF